MVKQRFYIDIPGDGENEFLLTDTSLEFIQKPYKKEYFFREDIKAGMSIVDPVLFKKLYQLEKDRCNCNVVDIRISENCCNEIDEERWKGMFSFIDGKWDIDECSVDLKPRIEDEYSCYIQDMKREKNYLDIEDRVVIKSRYGEIQVETCIYSYQAEDENGNPLPEPLDATEHFNEDNHPPVITPSCLTDQNTWSLSENFAEQIGNSNLFFIQQTYVREFVDTPQPPPGTTGWIAVVGGWARPIVTQFNGVEFGTGVQDYSLQWPNNPELASDQWQFVVDYTYIGSVEIDNAILLKDVITHYVNDCFNCVISNFFGINPDGTNPDNPEYEKAETFLHNAVVMQASDVIFVDASKNAQKAGGKAGRKKWEDIWTDLREGFDLISFYDETNNCFRIEHRSYKKSSKMIDLSDDKYDEYVQYNYTYNKSDIPYRQVLKPKYKTDHIDFDNGYIEYEQDCSDDTDQNGENSVDLKCFVTNINRLYNNEDYLDDDNAINSMILVAVDPSFTIVTDVVERSGDNIINSPFAMSSIVRNWWTQERPACVGDVNGKGNTQFLSLKKVRKLPPITLPMACNSYKTIQPETTILKTKIGLHDITDMKYVDNQLTLESIF